MPVLTAAMLATGRDLSEPRWAPDAGAIVAVVGWHGRAALVRLPADGGPEELLTTDPAPRPGRAFGGGQWAWCPDGTWLALVAGGDLWRQPADGTIAARLTEQPPGAPVSAPAVSPDGHRVAYVVDTHHVEVRDVDDPPRRRGRPLPHADFALDPAWSPDGTLLAWHQWSVPAMPWDESEVVVADATTGAVVGRVGGRCIAVQQPRFGAHGRLGLVSDATGWPVVHVTDATATRPPEPVVDEPHEHATAAWGPGQRSWCWSPDGTAIAWCRNEAGHGRLCVADVATAEGAAVTELARGWHGGLDWSPAGLVAVRSGARTPTQLVTYALPGGERCVRAHGPVAGVRALELVEPEPVSWTADDGARIPGRLYHPPAGEVAGLLVWIHGGPTGQWPVEWNARIAAWVSRGWGVLVPDHRGSTGWGRAFQQALNGSWGVLDAEDVAAGAAVARRAGWSGAGPVVGLGGSAGGFTVLNVLVRRPGALDAAVVAYPVTDLVALDDTTHRFEAHANATLVGPRPEHEHRFRDRSPLAHAGRITVPVLVFHGRDDVVVPVAQSQALVAAVQAAGGDAELVVYDGEGHGWSRPATGADELARTEAFLARMQARGR